MGCSNNHGEYIESAQNPYEKSVRLFIEELELNAITFYDILSDFNYTFLHFNDVIPEKLFDDYIKIKFKNEHIKTLFQFEEIRSQAVIKIQIVRYLFLLLCRGSVKNKKVYDKAEFIMNNILSDDEGEMQIQEKLLNLINLDCKIIPTFVSICNPSISEVEKQYINRLQNYNINAIYYVMDQTGLNSDVTKDVLIKKFEENPNVIILYRV